MRTEVVKVQRPTASFGVGEEPPPILIYDRSRKHSINISYAEAPKWLINELL